MNTLNFDLPNGTYVVAVSGGVDSMALLDALVKQAADHKFVVAHFDHGIRLDSALDRKLVQEVATAHGLQFVFDQASLGYGASEAVARAARYEFLRKVQRAARARAIITAHHQDDLLETALINLLRGTNRRGLSSLKSRHDIMRPLLHLPKSELINYAKSNGLVWREDSTNTDVQYLRNKIRHTLLRDIPETDKQKLIAIIHKAREVNHELDHQLENYLHLQPATDKLDRQQFIQLPHAVAREVMAAWLRAHGVRTYDKKMLERLIVAAKTFAPGKLADVQNGHKMHINVKFLALVRSAR